MLCSIELSSLDFIFKSHKFESTFQFCVIALVKRAPGDCAMKPV